MSDPALSASVLPPGALSGDAVPRDPEAVYIFDFDGVVASGIEDAIYRLPERPREREILADMAGRYCLRIDDMEHRYQRHLLFQEAAADLGLEIAPGPGFDLARWACATARCFILTARSGWSATARARDFIRLQLHPPIEMYQVGRTSKAPQISLLCQEFPSRLIYYIEDSAVHLTAATSLRHNNLVLVHCAEIISERDALSLYTSVLGRIENDARA